jgi:hypothetical protein
LVVSLVALAASLAAMVAIKKSWLCLSAKSAEGALSIALRQKMWIMWYLNKLHNIKYFLEWEHLSEFIGTFSCFIVDTFFELSLSVLAKYVSSFLHYKLLALFS